MYKYIHKIANVEAVQIPLFRYRYICNTDLSPHIIPPSHLQHNPIRFKIKDLYKNIFSSLLINN